MKNDATAESNVGENADKTKSKIFILDTNVPLHNANCCSSFEEHDVVIPVEVLSELDKFKKGFDSINFNAREFIRFLDSFPSEEIINGGSSLGSSLGKIRILLDPPLEEKIKKNFPEKIADHKILNTTLFLSLLEENKNKDVILVSKDVNLRMKAKAIGLKAEDYKTDLVSDVKSLYEKARILDISNELINKLYADTEIEYSNPNLMLNQFVILNSTAGGRSALAVFKKNKLFLLKKENVSVFGIRPKNSEQAFALHALLDPEMSLVTIMGKAGTGKTIIALAAALEVLSAHQYDQIFFTRATLPIGRQHDIGFLPGDAQEKLNPFMQAMSDNLAIIGENPKYKDKIDKAKTAGKIVIEPLGFIRGRSLSKKFFIIDECQNLTPQDIKTIITRAGEGTKFVLLGDITQIDDPCLNEASNGLSHVIDKMKGEGYYAHVVFHKSERSHMADRAGDLL